MKVPDLRNEWWLAKRIFRKDLCILFVDVTDVGIRRDRVRREIIDRRLEESLAGKDTTYAQAFCRLYGEPLRKAI